MRIRCLQFISLLPLLIAPLYGSQDGLFMTKKELRRFYHKEKDFIANHKQLESYYGYKNILLIASPGRSGSTLLTDVVKKYASKYKILKTHLLPPDSRFKGKILFIYSNPDKAAESACHLIMYSRSGGATHFYHVETSDQEWFNQIGRDGKNQNERYNLLAYDALGCGKQLEEWFYRKTQSCNLEQAQILAIKYENLWDRETCEAISEFLKVKAVELPPKKERGCNLEELSSKEKTFRELYNMGTDEGPIYHAYDVARKLWEQAPPFQFLKLSTPTQPRE